MQVMTISVANVISLLLFGSWMINAPNYGQAVLLCSSVTKLCSTHCDPMDCSLPGSSVHGIYQARILEWVAISLSIKQKRIEYLSQYLACEMPNRVIVEAIYI